MEVTCSFLTAHFQSHYKKLILICTATASVYLLKKYMEKRWKPKSKKEKKKIKEFPTIDQIQKFIENLPFDAVRTGKAVTLKDLLGELSEFSDDEDWKELIASVHTMYQDTEQSAQEPCEDTVSIMSIYEDPNVINMCEETARGETNDVENELIEVTKMEENVFQGLQMEFICDNKGKGDEEENVVKRNEEELIENLLLGKMGEGDKESKYQL